MRSVPMGVVVVCLMGGSSCTGNAGGAATLPTTSESPSVYAGRERSARCDAEERCAATNGHAYSSMQACRDSRHTNDALTVHATGRTSDEFLDQAYTVDASKTQGCLDAIAAQPCADLGHEAACSGVLIPKAVHHLGDPCGQGGADDLAQCPDTAYCGGSSSACFVCKALPAPGPVGAAKGDTCTGADCRDPLSCAGSPGARTCQERTGAGSSCANTPQSMAPGCYRDFVCEAGQCVRLLPNGAVCRTDGSTGRCAGYAPCKTNSSTALEGTCGFAVTTAGGACGWQSGNLGTGQACSVGQWPDLAAGGACTCRALLDNGETCPSHGACKTSNCAGLGANPATGMCAPPGALGATCGFDEGCDSRSCNVSTRQCVALVCN